MYRNVYGLSTADCRPFQKPTCKTKQSLLKRIIYGLSTMDYVLWAIPKTHLQNQTIPNEKDFLWTIDHGL